jgi:hypothetical protein
MMEDVCQRRPGEAAIADAVSLGLGLIIHTDVADRSTWSDANCNITLLLHYPARMFYRPRTPSNEMLIRKTLERSIRLGDDPVDPNTAILEAHFGKRRCWTIDRQDDVDNVESLFPDEGILYTAPQADISTQSRLRSFGQRALQIWPMN